MSARGFRFFDDDALFPKTKYSPKIKAAAELEMRRRQREAGKNCQLCDILEEVAAIYDGKAERPESCPHDRIQQIPDPHFLANIELIYGDPQPQELLIFP